jgi:hypothetical protein
MKGLKDLIASKLKKGERMSDNERDAKSGILDELDGLADEGIADGMKSVTVAAPDEEGLEKGLEMAQDIAPEVGELSDEMEETSEMDVESEMEDEMEEEFSIEELEELLSELKGRKEDSEMEM